LLSADLGPFEMDLFKKIILGVISDRAVIFSYVRNDGR
jgi:hypothetical protein